MSETREAPTSAWIDGKLYVTGGWGADGDPTGVTEVYDPAANAWTTVADNPKPHAGAGVAVLDGKLYVDRRLRNDTCGNTDVEVYDPAATAGRPAPTTRTATAWAAAAASPARSTAPAAPATTRPSAKTYSFDGTAWTPLADLPADDWGAAYSAANGQLVVSGGGSSDNTRRHQPGVGLRPGRPGRGRRCRTRTTRSTASAGRAGSTRSAARSADLDPAHAESEVLPGYDSCAAGAADVPWLSEDPAETDLAPGASVTVTVTMDPSTLAQPGTYKATICGRHRHAVPGRRGAGHVHGEPAEDVGQDHRGRHR